MFATICIMHFKFRVIANVYIQIQDDLTFNFQNETTQVYKFHTFKLLTTHPKVCIHTGISKI
jgi:hypothetical protein